MKEKNKAESVSAFLLFFRIVVFRRLIFDVLAVAEVGSEEGSTASLKGGSAVRGAVS